MMVDGEAQDDIHTGQEEPALKAFIYNFNIMFLGTLAIMRGCSKLNSIVHHYY